MSDKIYKYSEIFYSFQGEGLYTGIPTVWIRFFKCNLQCDGFGQKDPTDPSTYELPYKTVDISDITCVEDLPVFKYGCDSSYSWSKRYRHLAHDHTANEICHFLEDEMKHETNPSGYFIHPLTKQDTHLAFTGGEPMLNQDAMVDIMRRFALIDNLPHYVTVETNGTRPLKESLSQLIDDFVDRSYDIGVLHDWFWSCSPKLWSTAGEKPKKAIKPEVLAVYNEASSHGQLKYVVNGSQASWDEVEEHTNAFRDVGIKWPVYIMPVGARREEQEEDIIGEIAIEAMKRGYYFSGRLHCYVFGNVIGT